MVRKAEMEDFHNTYVCVKNKCKYSNLFRFMIKKVFTNNFVKKQQCNWCGFGYHPCISTSFQRGAR